MSDFTSLEEQARRFSYRNSFGKARPPQRYLVFDLEYEYDDESYEAYRATEGRKNAEERTRWPFHRIRAASWLLMDIMPGEREPRFGEITVMTAEDHSEQEMVEALFEQFETAWGAIPVTWGGETKDLAVLRQCACQFGLIVPAALRDLRPHSSDRIDLCLQISGGSENVHLPEYAAATSIPAKPSPSKHIGYLVKTGKWDMVEEQARADVLTTAIILLRHLASRNEADIDPTGSAVALAEAAAKAAPRSRFITGTLAAWARAMKNRAALKGTVYRMSA